MKLHHLVLDPSTMATNASQYQRILEHHATSSKKTPWITPMYFSHWAMFSSGRLAPRRRRCPPFLYASSSLPNCTAERLLPPESGAKFQLSS